MKEGSRGKSSGQKAWILLLAYWRSIGLSLSFFCCVFSSWAQSLPPSVIQSPITISSNAQAEPQVGTISGTVIDESGAVVVGAGVTLTRADVSEPQGAIVSRKVASGENGEFSFTNVSPGAFQIQITAAGFATRSIAGVLPPGGAYLVPPITLDLASLNTEIQVRPPSEVAEAQIKEQEKQRVFGVVPNFYVSYVADAVPLNAKQKWELAWKSTLDPVTFALTGLVAGVEQAQNSFGAYGQGAQGYAKRYAAAYVDGASSTLIGSALLPVLLKQDPRYFYKGTGTTRSRILYAIANSVICKGDNQHWQPNYSAILGGLASGGISNLYYPPQDRGAALVFENTAIGTGTTAILNLLQEFVVKRFTPHVPNNASSQH